MNRKRAAKVLAVHAEELISRPGAMQQINVTDEERDRMAPFFQLAERLQQSMQPVEPSAAFVRSLSQELVENAKRQIALSRRLRRAVLIGAAALGSLLSIASVVGAIVFVVVRLRARARTQAIHASTGQTGNPQAETDFKIRTSPLLSPLQAVTLPPQAGTRSPPARRRA